MTTATPSQYLPAYHVGEAHTPSAALSLLGSAPASAAGSLAIALDTDGLTTGVPIRLAVDPNTGAISAECALDGQALAVIERLAADRFNLYVALPERSLDDADEALALAATLSEQTGRTWKCFERDRPTGIAWPGGAPGWWA